MDKEIENLNDKIGVIIEYLDIPKLETKLKDSSMSQTLENMAVNMSQVAPILEREIFNISNKSSQIEVKKEPVKVKKGKRKPKKGKKIVRRAQVVSSSLNFVKNRVFENLNSSRNFG